MAWQQRSVGPWHLALMSEKGRLADGFILDAEVLAVGDRVCFGAACTNYLQGGLGGGDNGKHLSVACGAALQMTRSVPCEVSQVGGLPGAVLAGGSSLPELL